MHVKDCIKDKLKKYNIPCEDLEECASDHNNWNKATWSGRFYFEEVKRRHAKLKRDVRKGITH